jgi:hypothetical protein
MRASRSFASLVLVSALLVAGAAAAQEEAGADARYNRAVTDMVAGKYDEACPIIEDAYRADPRPGRLFTLAECEAGRGRIASAVARYDEYLAVFAQMPPEKQAKQQGREGIAITKRAALAPHVPQLTVLLPPGAPGGTVVKRDGAVIAEASVGVALPVDPGDHTVTGQAPGGPVVEVRVTLGKDEKKQVTLPLAAPRAEPTPSSIAAAPPPQAPPPSDAGPSGQRVAAFVVGGVGVAGVIVGAVMGGLVLSKQGTVKANCAGMFCDAAGAGAVESAKPLGVGSTVGFIVGGAGLVVGVVLLATDRSTPRAAAGPPALQVGLVSIGGGAGIGIAGAL